MEPRWNGTRSKGTFTALGAFSILAGLLVLGENYGLIPAVHKVFWPIVTGALGYGFILLYRQGRGDGVLVGTGTYILAFSVLAVALNFTSWGMLRWLWPLFVGFLGLSLLAVYIAVHRDVLYLAFGLGFISLCLVFFFVFSVDPWLWPISLVFFGLTILLVNILKGRK